MDEEQEKPTREELLAKQEELGRQKLAIFDEIKHLQAVDCIGTPQQKQVDELDKQLWEVRNQLESLGEAQ